MDKKPTIVITIGDPYGIGPEIVVKALTHPEIYSACIPIVSGNKEVLKHAAGIIGCPLSLSQGKEFYTASTEAGSAYILENEGEFSPEHIGSVQASGGRIAFNCIKSAVRLAMENKAEAIATAPINKEALRKAKVDYIGHTEILAGLTGATDPLTMFEARGLRVFFLTRHVPLKKACDMITKDRILDYIVRCTEALKKIGAGNGKMAVAGLNPHSGEHGLFGNEEQEQIVPAVQKAQELGYNVEGPISADSVFYQALTGKYNSVLSLYHDQGHIATKTLDFERTIAITHGLPFLRASVDHGTAFDIAGAGIAREISMVEAILLAAKYIQKRM